MIDTVVARGGSASGLGVTKKGPSFILRQTQIWLGSQRAMGALVAMLNMQAKR